MESARKLDLRLVVGLLAVAFAAMTIWATTGLAGGSAAAGTNAPATDPSAAFVQDDGETPQEEDGLPLPGDCPERDGEDESGSSDASSSDL